MKRWNRRARANYDSPASSELCGVFMGYDFCENPQYRYRRCEVHFAALKRDDLFDSLKRMDDDQRERALDMLDQVQKVRPRWEYEGREAELIASQERES
jgi:hypothetical protein